MVCKTLCIDHRPFPYYLTVSLHGITCPGVFISSHSTACYACNTSSYFPLWFRRSITIHSLHSSLSSPSTFPANYVFAGFDIMYLMFLSHTIFSFSIQYCILRFCFPSRSSIASAPFINKPRKTVLPVGMKYKSILQVLLVG